MWGQCPQAGYSNYSQPFAPNNRNQNNHPQHPRAQQTYYHRQQDQKIYQYPRAQQTYYHKEDQKIYNCPGCLQHFECLFQNNQFLGRVPLILKCQHTLCQDCIYKQCHTTQIVCHTCKKESSVGRRHLNNLQEVFPPNFYLIGFMMWFRTQNNQARSMNLVPTQVTLKSKQTNTATLQNDVNQSTDRCCFLTCSKNAEFYCNDCNDNYCGGCNVTIHKSAKSMWVHKTTLITDQKIQLELEKCTVHGNIKEFYCNVCEHDICVYCFVENHEGHEKTNLAFLGTEENFKLDGMRKKAKKVFAQLRKTQQKLTDLKKGNTEVAEKQIRSYFANLHGELYCVEKKLIDEAVAAKNDVGGLEDFSRKIRMSMQKLERVLSIMDAKHLNQHVLMDALKDVDTIPRFLLSESGDFDTIKFIVEPKLEPIESFFKLKKFEASYSLVSEDQLPEDYEIDGSDEEIDMSEISENTSISKMSTKSQQMSTSASTSAGLAKKAQPHHTKNKARQPKWKKNTSNKNLLVHPSSKNSVEKVTVTHVNSLESFFVQHHKFEKQYNQMENDIKEHIAKDPPYVVSPELNEVYLGLVGKLYARGRVVKEFRDPKTNDKKYDFYLMDRGTTETIDAKSLREITPSLAQRKPFAFECQLHNPTFINWSKDAHVHFAKLINKKEVHMLTKNYSFAVHEVEVMISSSTGQLTSVTDLLINTCNNVLSSSEEAGAVSPSPDSGVTYSQEIKLYPNSVKFHVNKTMDILIAYVNTPHDIYVQEYSNADVLAKLTTEMDRHYKKALAGCVPIANTYVVVRHKGPKTDGLYHRAFVRNVNAMEDRVDVFLVDWGIKTCVPTEDVKLLTESFTRLECQAIKVKLAHIEPYNMENDWSQSAIIFLEKFAIQKNQLKMTVNAVNPLEVVLFEENGAVDYCLNAQLVAERLAESTGKLSAVVEWPQIKANVSSKTEDVSLIGNMLNNVTLNSEDDDDSEAMQGLPKLIEISKFVSPDLIFIRLLDSRETHQQLYKEIQIHYSDPKVRIKMNSCKVNDKCVIYHTKQKAYCRGKIEDILDNGTCKIYLQDSGESEIVVKDNIFQNHEYFNKYLPAAIKACLADIKPAGDTGKWSTSAIDALKQTLKDNRELYVTKAGKLNDDFYFPVVMWYKHVIAGQGALDPSYIKYVSINNVLVKLGFAYRCNPKNKTESNRPDLEDEPVKLEQEEEKPIVKNNQPDGSPYRRIELPSADWHPAFKLKKRKFRALITCADDLGGYLYLHDEAYQVGYENLEEDIKAYFDFNQITRKRESWLPGQICTISYDQKWYRGKVTQVRSQEKIEVIMIDFGSTHLVHPNDLYIEILYPDIPAFATKVTLHNVHPKCGKWLTSDHDLLMKIVEEHADVVVHGPLEADVPEVTVFLDSGICLNKELVKRSQNLVEAHSLKTETTDDDDEPIVMEDEEIVDLTQLELRPTESYTLAELPKSALDKGSRMSILNVLNYNTVILNYANQSGDYFALFETMTEEMQEQSSSQPPLENIDLDRCCVCPYSEDDKWYRAKVYNLEGMEYGVVFVLFVDYGNIESVSCSDLRAMKPEWFQLPLLNHIAKVDIELCVTQQADHVTTQIKKLTNKTKTIEIVNEEPLTVRILEDDGSFSYQNLIDKGLIKAN
ncbi:unnamed protein product [Brassicogethes aeneus]|uniref:RING finger protein 17 n=1 Tax=Brassicogethes aeneus TaxID=1431903 RepID=A0A9P0FJI8_BRAAE|nr:unnamed protein product [Brassicogethes aeneus]